MERRDFFSGTISALLLSVIKPISIANDRKEKPCIVGIGTAGSKIAKAVYDILPYNVRYLAIESENNYNTDDKQHVTAWYQSKILQRSFTYEPINESHLADDWDYNMSRYYFPNNLEMLSGNIIVVAGLGRKTGSYVSYRLIQYLFENKKSTVQFIGTKPFGFEGKQCEYICEKYSNLIKGMGVKVTLFDCRENTKGNMPVSGAFKFMDELIVKSVAEKVKKINA